MGYIYFIGGSIGLTESMVKIGFTRSHPKLRLKALQTGCPVVLDLLAYAKGEQEYERALHAKYAAFWSHNEWFLLSDDIRENIWDIRFGSELYEIVDLTGADMSVLRDRRARVPTLTETEAEHWERVLQ